MKASRGLTFAINAISGGLTRAGNLLIALLFVPLAIKVLGVEGYGMVSVAISLATFAAYADLGLGIALTNTVAAVNLDDPDSARTRLARQMVSNAWFFLLSAGVTFAGFAFGFAALAQTTANVVAALSCAIIFIGLPFGLYQRVLFARQHNFLASGSYTVGRFLVLVVVWTLSQLGTVTPVAFALCLFGVPLAVNAIGTIATFTSSRFSRLRPTTQHANMRAMPAELSMGLSFMLLQLVPFVEVGIDNALLALRYPANTVSAYDVNYRLFAYVPAMMSLLLFPLWPAIAKALAESDMGWVRKVRNLSYLLVGFASSAIAMALFVFHETIIFHWTGESLPLDISTIAAFACFSVVTSMTLVQSMVLNGHGLIREQMRFFAVYLLLLLPVKLAALWLFGVSPMAWTSVFAGLVRFFLLWRLSNRH